MPSGLRGKVINALSGDRVGTMDLGNGGQLQYKLGDTYWRGHAKDIRGYEPEIWALADRFVNKDTVFVDCGANIGLWSCYAGAKIGNPDQVIAVEAGDEVGKTLRANHALNRGSFTLMPNAIWSKSGETMTFKVHKRHAGSSLMDDASEPAGDVRRIEVKTITIDDIVEQALRRSPRARDVVIKLDVEGVERPAMDGAQRTLKGRNAMVVYEDHGKERESETTADFLRRWLKVYYVDGDTTQVKAVTAAAQLRPIKTDVTKGYNFVACPAGCAFDKALAGLAADNQPLGGAGQGQARKSGYRA